jgi:hypothetical protein
MKKPSFRPPEVIIPGSQTFAAPFMPHAKKGALPFLSFREQVKTI